MAAHSKQKKSAAKTSRPMGRPPKFLEARRPVTVTLPERTLASLGAIDRDRAKAIVKAVDSLVNNGRKSRYRLDVVEVAPGTGVLVVPLIRGLDRIPWLHLIELAPMRHLIAIAAGTPIEKIELALTDLIELDREMAPNDVPLLEALRNQLRHMRRDARISKAEILFVAMPS